MTNFHMGFISDVLGQSPNSLPPSLPTALFLLLLHMGLGAQLEIRINKEVVLNLCFVMISLHQKRESKTPDALTVKLKAQSFAPLVLVQACMLIQYWRARVLLSKFAASVAGEVATLCVQNVVAVGI